MNHLCLYTDCFVLFGHFYFIIHVLCIENINFLIIIFIANTFPQKKNSLYVGSYGFYNNCSKVIILGCELGLQCTEIFKSFCLSLAVLVKIKNL